MTAKTEERCLKTDLQMIKRALGIIREISPGILQFSIARAVINALTPYIAIYMSALIIDELVSKRSLKLLILYVFAAVGGTLLMTIVAEFISKKVNVLNTMFVVKFKDYLNHFSLTMDYSKIEEPKFTELHSKIIGTMFMVNGGITSMVGLITTIVNNAVSVIIAVIIIAKSTIGFKTSGFSASSVLFFLLLIAVIAVCIAVTVRNSKIENKKEFRLFLNCATNRYGNYYHFNYMEDDKAGKDIHIFDQRKLIIDDIRTKAREPWMKILLDKSGLVQKYFGTNVVISAFLGGFAYIFVGLRALSGSISLGSVTRSYASIVRLVSSVGNLFVSLSQIKSNNNYLKVLYEFLDTPSEHHAGNQIPEEPNGGWELEFHHVSFRYPSCEKYALKNLSFKISSNSRTAIVGMNGSGKTTMIKLLCRLYRPETGTITLNGKNIQEYDYDAYLKLFSVVFQDFKLLAFPIGENVAASGVYDAAKVRRSLKAAGLEEKVASLPLNIRQHIYKNVDPNGMDISGGEEQKLAIARAFYKDAPFMIFDEPTAALDPVAEYEIYNKFNEIIGNKAAVFVSHRLSSCRFCDTIAVFHNGEIVQSGTHDELLKNAAGKYYELWNAQAQYYKESAACVSE